MSNLSNQLAITEREEVARGIRLLLASPLISSRAAPDWFDLVRRRREPIRRWFDYYCGWTLIVEPRLGYARLVKVRGAGGDPSRPARRTRSGRAPFDRRRYVLLCLAAAELLAVPVTTIGLLADRISRASALDPVLAGLDSASRAERMAFVDRQRLLQPDPGPHLLRLLGGQGRRRRPRGPLTPGMERDPQLTPPGPSRT